MDFCLKSKKTIMYYSIANEKRCRSKELCKIITISKLLFIDFMGGSYLIHLLFIDILFTNLYYGMLYTILNLLHNK